MWVPVGSAVGVNPSTIVLSVTMAERNHPCHHFFTIPQSWLESVLCKIRYHVKRVHDKGYFCYPSFRISFLLSKEMGFVLC